MCSTMDDAGVGDNGHYSYLDKDKEADESGMTKLGGNFMRTWRMGDAYKLSAYAEAVLIILLITSVVWLFYADTLPGWWLGIVGAALAFYVYDNYTVWKGQASGALASVMPS